MFNVLSNEILAPQVHRMVIQAPQVASARKAGQFVIVRVDEGHERIPLTIADASIADGTITLIVQAIGRGTQDIVAVQPGQCLRDVAGPLGSATEVHTYGRVACIGGGVGTAVLYPLAKELARERNKVTALIGGRTSQHVLLRKELGEFCTVKVATDDGSLGRKGLVTDLLSEMMADPKTCPQAVYAVGPVPMMAAVANLTRPAGIKTVVSLNPIMVDGTGMCGGCRVTVGGKVRFACVDGPEFDGHDVDFRELSSRQKTYHEHDCRLAMAT